MGGGAAPRHKGGRRVTRKSASPGLWRGTGAQTQWAAASMNRYIRAGRSCDSWRARLSCFVYAAHLFHTRSPSVTVSRSV